MTVETMTREALPNWAIEGLAAIPAMPNILKAVDSEGLAHLHEVVTVLAKTVVAFEAQPRFTQSRPHFIGGMVVSCAYNTAAGDTLGKILSAIDGIGEAIRAELRSREGEEHRAERFAAALTYMAANRYEEKEVRAVLAGEHDGFKI